MSERVRCPDPKCGAFDGHHGPHCEMAPDEWKLRWLPVYLRNRDKAIGELYRTQDHLRALVTLWQGKYALVKHENNQLRRKLKRQGEE